MKQLELVLLELDLIEYGSKNIKRETTLLQDIYTAQAESWLWFLSVCVCVCVREHLVALMWKERRRGLLNSYI